MKRLFAALAVPIAPVLGLLFAPSPQSPDIRLGTTNAAVVERDPFDLVLLPGNRAAVANRASGTIALVDLGTGTFIGEIPVGKQPTALASTQDGNRLAATTFEGGELLILSTRPDFRIVHRVRLGGEPRGVAVDPAGTRAWVALSDADSVAEVDLATGKTRRRIVVGDEPWSVALSPDGRNVLVGLPKEREIVSIDTATGTVKSRTRTAGRNIRRIAVDPSGSWAYFPMIAERQAPADRVNIDRGWVVGNRLARVRVGSDSPREAITLDSLGAGVADVDGCAIAPDGSALALAAAGSHEVVLFESPSRLPFVSFGGPGDHVDPDARRQMVRVKVDGAPVACRFSLDGKSVWVAERFGNRLVRIDRTTRRVDKIVSLPAPSPSIVRQGEAVFHDASRSFGSWYSCATCHTEGHTNGGNFDTLNDGGYGKPKKTPSLRGVARTAPYTWHGWQPSLRQAVLESFTKSMQGPVPPDADVDAVTAWLATLEVPGSPVAVGPSAKRGEELFVARGCASCHAGSERTSPKAFRVGLEETDDHFAGFNPPSLRNVRQRGPWLHDGRAGSLEELLGVHHSPRRLGIGKDFTATEVSDLVDFLTTL